MPEPDDRQLLHEAALRAGEIAVKYFRQNPKTWDKGDGQGPVTQADLEIDEMLRATLLSARPNYGWLSEETEDDAARLSCDTVFIVDPIDGTRAFVEGRETFAHSLAIAHEGRVTDAVIHLPLREKTYSASLGQGAVFNGTPIQTAPRDGLENADILAGKWNTEPGLWRGGVAPFKRHFRSSLAYRLGLVAEGRFDAMITLRSTWEWDVAAGALIVSEAGGIVSDWNNAPARFNNEKPFLDGMIAAGQQLHKQIMAELSPRA